MPRSRGGDDEHRVTALALAAGKGDRRALEDWVRATQPDVWRFLAHLTDVRSADDLTQETYLRALGSLHRFAGRSCSRTWVLSIARRVVVDQIRSASARPRVSSGVDWELAAEAQSARAQRSLAGFEDVVELQMLLGGLEQDRREVLVLTQVLGLTYQETADVLGCPLGTIRSRVARAREDLLATVEQTDNGTG